MSIYQVRTFGEILATIREEMQFSSSDTTKLNRIKRDVNAILNEIAAEKNWWWLQGSVSLQLPAYISSGTATVTAGSSGVTLTVAPAASMDGYWFAVDGFQEIYRVESHTAGALTLKLDGLFAGSTSSTATYKLWKDRIPLPTDCKETLSVYHEYFSTNLDAKGLQEFRRITALNPRAEGKPAYYFTGDFKDPSQTSSITSLPAVSTRASTGPVKTLVFASGLPTSITSASAAGDPIRLRIQGAGDPSYNGDVLVSTVTTTSVANDTLIYTGKGELQESATSDSRISVTQLDQEVEYDRYRELFLYPCLNTSRVLIHVDYIKQVLPLNNDSDEPVIPLEDRMVLVYGALSRAWSRDRNPDEATRNLGMYKNKLAKMAGKLQDSQESPRFAVNKEYLRSKRNISMRGGLNGFAPPLSGSGASGSSVVTGTANSAAIFNSSGELVAASTVSDTELGYLDGATSNIQTQIDALADPSLTSAHIFVGNASNLATDVAVSGDLTMANTGAATVATVGGSTAANIHAAEALANAATNANTASTIVKRDASGNFTAGTITSTGANVTGLTASTAVVTDASKNLASLAYTNANTASTLVERDSSGNFSAGTITAALTGTAATATAPATGSAHGAVTLDASGNFQTIAPGTAGHYVRSNGTDYVQGTIANTDLSGITNTQLSGSAAITNANLATMASSSSTVGTVKGNVSGSAATPSDVVLTSANTASSAVYRDSSGNFSAGTVTAAVTGTASGNLTASANNHGILVSGSANTATVVAPDAATTKYLKSGGSSADPSWSAIDISTAAVTGTLAATNGGTAQATYTTGDTLYASATNTLSKLGIGTSGQFLKTINGIPGWGPGANGINYLTSNPDAETDTTGWTTYADAAGTTPVDATGGSPTFTWTRSTSSPLRGTGSFLATKDAANRQGEGVAFAITLDSADQAKPICVSFDYAVASGTYADGDLTVYLYDVTNAVVIQPAPYKVLAATAGLSQKWIGYFQTSAASTSYRIAIHTASTSASAYTVKFDNFNVGPTYQSYGAVEGDWTSFTPTGAWATGANTSYAGWYKRIGDSLSMLVKVSVTGTPTTASLTINLPSGLTIDTAKLPSTPTNTVFAGQVEGLSAAHSFVGVPIYSSTTSILLAYIADGSTASIMSAASITQAAPYTFANTDYVYVSVSGIPISGWSSNVQVSSDADTRVQNFLANGYSSGTISSTFAGSGNIVFATTEDDTHGAYSAGTVTIPVPGRYKITAHANVPGTYTVNQFATIAVNKNGTEIKDFSVYAGGSMSALQTGGEYTANFNAGDTLAMRVYSNATSPSVSNSSVWTFFGVTRVGGPAQIAASESVSARYTDAAGQNIVTDTIIQFATKDYDTHNAVTTGASWKFTAPMAGKYEINARFITGAATASAIGNLVGFRLSKNGAAASTYVAFSYAIVTGSIAKQATGATTVNLVQGDTISLLGVNNTGSTHTTGASSDQNFIEITRVGN